MKPKKFPLLFALILTAFGLHGWPPVTTAQIFMDMNEDAPGFGPLGGTNADAIWNTTNTNWTTNPLGTGQLPPADPMPLIQWNNTSGTTTFDNGGSGASIYLGNNFTVSGLAVTNTSGNFDFRSDDANAANTNTAIIVTGGNVHVPTGGTLRLLGSSTAATTLIGAFTKTGGGTLSYIANSSNFSNLGTITSLTVQEGQMNLPRANLLTTSSTVALTGGILNLAADRSYMIGSLSGTSGSIIWGSSDTNRILTINQTTNEIFGGIIEGQAGGGLRSVVKEGAATLTLTGANTYNGTMTISAGALQVGNGGTTGSLSNTNTINNAALIFNRSNDSTYGQVISGSGTVTKTGAGTKTLTGTNLYVGATTVNGGTLLISGTGAINSTSGITVNSGGTLSYSSSTGLDRNITLNSGGTFAHNGSNPYTGTLTWNGGTLAGTNFSGVSLAVGANKTLSPGNSPGTMTSGNQTWTNGGNFNLEIHDFDLAPGTGFDTIAITGTLDLTGLTAGGFNINLWSLSSVGPDANGNALNFDNVTGGSWLIVSTTDGVSGFNPSLFTINLDPFNGTGGFSNDLGGGTFSVNLIGNNLFLEFTPIPEPSSWLMLGAGLCVVTLLRRRRRSW